LVSGLFEASAPRVSEASARPKGYLRDALQAEPADEREDALLVALRALVGEVLGDASVVDDLSGFAELGLDSIMAIDVRTRLSHALAIDLPATLAIDYPSVSALAKFVHGRLFAEAAPKRVERPRAPALEQPQVSAPALPDALGELSLEQLLSAVQLELAAGE
jgi:acyl carrier protein